MQEEFLNEEYTIWLNTLFSREVSTVLQIKYDMDKFKLLFKYVEEYLKSDLASQEEKDYYLKYYFCYHYNFTYNDMYIEVTKQTNGDLKSYNPVISSYLVAKLNDKSKVGVPPIDLNKVREYVSLKVQKENKPLYAFIKVINELESKGVDREEIINDLQIAYAYVVNKDTREKYNTKGR